MWSPGRIFIPFPAMSGERVSWRARDICGKNSMKSLFPRGLEGAEYVFNAWAIPKSAPRLIVTERVIGAYGWWRASFKYVATTFGKKYSKQQLEILRLLALKILAMAWDTVALWQSHMFCRPYGGFFLEARLADMGGRGADEMTRGELADVLRRAAEPSWKDMLLMVLTQITHCHYIINSTHKIITYGDRPMAYLECASISQPAADLLHLRLNQLITT